MSEALKPAGSNVLKGQRDRFTLYFCLSIAIAVLYVLLYLLASSGVIKYPPPEWFPYLTIVSASLLFPAAYGLLFALLARWRLRENPGIVRHGFSWVAVLLGLVAVPAHFFVARGLSRVDCGDTCVGTPSDMAWFVMAAISLAIAVGGPLLLAYYKWPKAEDQSVTYFRHGTKVN